jgi:hypothetical protein
MPVTNAEVTAALAKLYPQGNVRPEVAAQVTTLLNAPPPGGMKSAGGPAAGYSYYMANADHSRTAGTQSRFLGQLPLVRVPLPKTGNFDTDLVPTIQTAIGYLIPEDRLLASVAMVLEMFPGQATARVDFIGPARAPGPTGARFGAFSTYLCYPTDDADCVPTWYILEGGTGPGVPRVLYPSNGMNAITNVSLDYTPTTFSRESDKLWGLLTVQNNEPVTLAVTVTDTSGAGPNVANGKPYVTVNIDYVKQNAPPPNDPVWLIVEAAARLSIIGNTIGVDAGWTEDIADALYSWHLDWITKPGP